MNKCSNPTGLAYYLPEAPKVHTVLHIPGSHNLHIGPSSCTRRHAMHALEYGDRNDVSFLFITEADIISGDYELIVGDAVEDLLAVLEPQPHIFVLSVFCIDDFLGTDDKALVASLTERFPERQFVIDHIDPVILGENKKDSMKRRHYDMYAFLRPEEEHDRGINFIGNFVSHDPGCEIFELFRGWNAGPVRELFNCTEYEEYQVMAKSCITIGMRVVPDKTVKRMKNVLNIPYYYFPASYDVDFIMNAYKDIAGIMGCEMPDISADAEATERYARETAEALKARGISLAVDNSAFLMTFSTAAALLKYGFDVKYVFRGGRLFEGEEAAMKELQKRDDVKILWSDDFANTRNDTDSSNILAIGHDANNLLEPGMFADVWHDEGYFGLHGIRRLMDLIRKTAGVE